MLADEVLQSRYLQYLDKRIHLAGLEVERTKHQPEFLRLAQMYLKYFKNARFVFAEKYRRNIVTAFKNFQDMGKLEIITCGVTHGYLPLMNGNVNAMRAQIKVAVDHYEKHFGRKPRGIWLPECGYEPGIDQILKEAGIRFFITETHGILYASPRRSMAFLPLFTALPELRLSVGTGVFQAGLELQRRLSGRFRLS